MVLGLTTTADLAATDMSDDVLHVHLGHKCGEQSVVGIQTGMFL